VVPIVLLLAALVLQAIHLQCVVHMVIVLHLTLVLAMLVSLVLHVQISRAMVSVPAMPMSVQAMVPVHPLISALAQLVGQVSTAQCHNVHQTLSIHYSAVVTVPVMDQTIAYVKLAILVPCVIIQCVTLLLQRATRFAVVMVPV